MNGSRQTDPFLIRCGHRVLDCRRTARTLVMGILNVTPDSFADGGRYLAPEDALHRIDEMVAEGADIVDVGGESTRPRGRTYGAGASPVDAAEEIRRVVPVIRAATERHPDLVISIDTYKAHVAEAAVEAGACLINDVTGLRYDDRMAAVAASSEIPMVLMHSVGRPGEMPHGYDYEDVVDAVRESLRKSIRKAEQAGVRGIIVDPGFGFGKRVSDNMAVIGRLREFEALNRPVLVGVSRKSSIGSVLADEEGRPAPVEGRLYGSLAAAAAAIANGAKIVRCHDVAATRDVARTMDAIMASAHRPDEVLA